ncbi:hypothetical protein DFH09DRAFT_1454298 [Mycena vulgaris]|nr:hypothetical protein DFH09DRAFT_1454298 [Mycena vulgaris]
MSTSDHSTLLFRSPGLATAQIQVKGLIEAAEADIERLTRQIRELTCMREKERIILTNLRMMVVPIGKLPRELLVEIFKHAVHHTGPPLRRQSDVGTDETGGIEAFFLPLALPSPRTLDLKFDPSTDDYWPTDVFSQFQSRSPNIEEISLMFCQIESEGFLALLRHAPALTKLHLECCWNCITDNVLAALRYDGGGASPGPLVPKLQDMYLEYIGLMFEESLFEDTIRSRWWTDERAPPGASVIPLKKVRFLAPANAGLSAALKARMKELVGQGLDLDLH